MTAPSAGSSGSGPDRHDQVAKLVLAGLLIALLIAFILGNRAQVRVSLVLFHSRSSLIWVLLVTNLLGFVAGYLVHGRLGARRGRRRKKS
jgi:uncharacterized integral membrane protein